MSWFRRITLVLSLSSLLVFGLALGMNWIQGPGLENLAGEVKSSDLFQHYGAGVFVENGQAVDLYQGGKLGIWIRHQHKPGTDFNSSSFNYVYPPFLAWTASHLVFTGYPAFALIWLGLSVLFYLICISQLGTFWGRREMLFPSLLLLGLPSLHYSLILGQNSCLSFLIICSSALLLHRQRTIAAGLVLSCLFYKPQFLPLLAGFMFIQGHFRFVLAAAAGSLLWLITGLLVCGPASYGDWLQVLQNLSSGGQLQFAELNQTVKMFVLNLLGQSAHPGKITGPLTTFLGLGLLGLAAFSVRLARPGKKWSAAHSLLLASAVMTVTSPYLMHYDLLLAAGWWCLCLLENENQGWQNKALAATFWMVSLFSINIANWPAPATAPIMLLYLFFTMRNALVPSVRDSDGKSRNSVPVPT